ncbi:Outer membrane protein assembly factor BamB, contains PQQ-like beta-propeller repeat [Halomicrobium zhouii]|uniref:Outer membrane protein assembly factor BamB, contains PQQ-like beta-propeller repeat n=1 Tax=Halomicrobium zhouii TaxID=767519 RepID=A0A1I6L0J4_9EURY|nr:PQQ-binding-like beta-propeller repeat protein [Halomicrobium zhouii]SFR97003.1 Outer membrane protein assembly factor BamB, contains PQQ-like beta-propeller repeat [Halomicrobium zhouii]
MNRREFLSTAALATTLTAGCSRVTGDGDRGIEWKIEVGDALPAQIVGSDDSVYVGADSKIYRLSAATGEPKWIYDGAGDSYLRVHLHDETVYGGWFRDGVVAVDAESGNHRWSVQPLDSASGVTGLGSHPGTDAIYYNDLDGVAVALDPTDGELLWYYDTGGTLRDGPVVTRDSVYVASEDGVLYALAADTGEKRWQYDTGSKNVLAPTVANGTVYVGPQDATLYAVDSKDGTERWQYSTTTEKWLAPTVDGDVAYLATFDGDVEKIDLQTRERIWHNGGQGRSVVPPGVGPDNVYIGGPNRLVGISKSTGETVSVVKTGEIEHSSFHQTPLVSTDRVISGNTGGFVFATPRT